MFYSPDDLHVDQYTNSHISKALIRNLKNNQIFKLIILFHLHYTSSLTLSINIKHLSGLLG